jgi:hypothetical protein
MSTPLVTDAAQIRANLKVERDQRTREARREKDRIARQRHDPLDPIIVMLIAARKQRRWSLERVAREVSARMPSANENVSDRSIHMYEHGLRSPSLARLRHWAAVLDIELYAEVHS